MKLQKAQVQSICDTVFKVPCRSVIGQYRSRAVEILVVTLALLAFGCQHTVPPTHHAYETVGQDPRRNTDLAKQKNILAIAQIDQDKYSDAEKLLKEALDADVTYGPAHNNLGKVYYQEHKFYLAAWEFQYASKLMPDVPEPRNNLGLVLESVGKLDEAVGCYDEALKIGPDNPQFLGNDARARYRRGDRDEHLRSMLQDLLMRDTRSDWSAWAKEQLALMGNGVSTQP
jgi:Tfp pilus assembly protein PilF